MNELLLVVAIVTLISTMLPEKKAPDPCEMLTGSELTQSVIVADGDGVRWVDCESGEVEIVTPDSHGINAVRGYPDAQSK